MAKRKRKPAAEQLTEIPERADPAPASVEGARPDEASSEPDLSYISPNLRSHAVPIAQVAFLADNPREHGENDLEATKASLRKHGQVELLVVNSRPDPPVVLNGNGRLAGALSLGWSHIAVNFLDLSGKEARELAVHLNATGEKAGWNKANLEAIVADCPTGIGDPVLDKMMQDLAKQEGIETATTPATGNGGDEFDAEAAQQGECRVRAGDLWLIDGGKHRLLCGDSARAEDVARVMGGEKAGLMNTDPPYGVAYANDDRPNPGVAKPRVANDKLADEALQTFLESVFMAAVDHALSGNAAWYLWHAHPTQGYFAAAAAAANVVLHLQIIWVKPVLLLGRGQYHWKHEPCFMGWVKGSQPPDYGLGNGERTQTTVWEINGVSQAERKEFNHSTPKPVELFTIPMVKHLQAGEIAFEPFAGSGPQFVAAIRTSRRCFGLELEPRYCEAILRRCEAEGLSVELAERLE